MSVPQFGEARPGLQYKDRPAAFGVLAREGLIACVTVTKPGHAPWIDLPGGALDAGEDDAQALVREFGEETGLRVRAGQALGRADQYFINTDGVPYNNRAALFAALVVAQAPHLKIEIDHELVWLAPVDALKRLRHEAHAWAIAAWMRRRDAG
jgi:8-oxo-dGTP diphosphatase